MVLPKIKNGQKSLLNSPIYPACVHEPPAIQENLEGVGWEALRIPFSEVVSEEMPNKRKMPIRLLAMRFTHATAFPRGFPNFWVVFVVACTGSEWLFAPYLFNRLLGRGMAEAARFCPVGWSQCGSGQRAIR